MKIRVAAAVVALTGGCLAVSAAPASAEDQERCVAKVEYQSANGGPDTRAGMEGRWEVRGLGKTVDITLYLGWTGGPAWEAVAYPRCGYDINERWYGILYKTPKVGPSAGKQIPVGILEYH